MRRKEIARIETASVVVPESTAVEIVGSGFRDHLHVARGAELGRRDGRFDFHLLDTLDAGLHGTCALRESHDGNSVHGGQDPHLRPRATDNRCRTSRDRRRPRRQSDVGIDSAVSGMASDQGQSLHGFMTHGAGQIDGFRCDDRTRSTHFHQGRRGAQRELHIEVDNLVGGDDQAAALVGGEAFPADPDFVAPQIEIRHVEDAGRTGGHAPGRARSVVGHLDVGGGDHGAGGVLHRTRDRSERALRQAERDEKETGEETRDDGTLRTRHVFSLKWGVRCI